ncbi:MAG: hypothetical protein AB8B73_01200, partial [Ekhidna sp.]
MKEQLLRNEKKITAHSIIVLVVIACSVFGYRYSIISQPSYESAIDAIKRSPDVLADVGTIESFGFLPSISDVPDKEATAEYWITVFGEANINHRETDRRIQIVLEKGTGESWIVTYLSVNLAGQKSGGNDALILVSFLSGLGSTIFFLFLIVAYLKKRRLLLDPYTMITEGVITDVASRIDKATMDGESNHGIVSTDFENRAVTHSIEMFEPKVFFIDQEGMTRPIEHKFSSNKKYKRGDKIDVVYNIATPADAQLADYIWFWIKF